MSEWYGQAGDVFGGRWIHKCGALPLRGDGTGACTLEAFHRGRHRGDGGEFSRCIPGSSPRSPVKTRKRFNGRTD